MADFVRSAENLVKHANGTYYLRAKIGGKIVRKSLDTKELRIAKIKRDAMLGELRGKARRDKSGPRTIGELLDDIESALTTRPHIQPSTNTSIQTRCASLRKTLPIARRCAEFGPNDAAAWWAKIATQYAPAHANALLRIVRKMMARMVELGMREDEPTASLGRMRRPKSKLILPTGDQMRQIIAHIGSYRLRSSAATSRMVAFLAYSGLRKGEARRVTWDDVGADWLTVGADGKTKGGTFRQVPISEPLRAVLDAMRADNDKGRLFYLSDPRHSIRSACRAVGVGHLRVHDLRHFFATWCIESGVDVPTVAKWLGHKDGGALCMKTYGHVRDDHSLESVKKLK